MRHYKSYYRHGDPLYTDNKAKRCTVEGCEEKIHARLLCGMHYQRFMKHGDPTYRKIAEFGAGCLTPGGYVIICKNGIRKQQHRMVVEEQLGRELRNDENVHHKNGVRNDNRIENLELWTTSQPSGKRVADMIEFCLEFLSTYGKVEFNEHHPLNRFV